MARRTIERLLWEVEGDFGRTIEEAHRGVPRVARARFWEPRVDLLEEDGRFVIKAEIAGVRGEDITLVYLPERHALVIRGHREEPDLSGGGRTAAHTLEVYYGEFQREVALPDVAIDAAAIRAQYRNGFLFVSVPKLSRAGF